MANTREYRSTESLDLAFGLILGLLGGALFGILFAPKPGRELQDDVQKFMNRLPDELSDKYSSSRKHYQEFVGKTRQNIETKREQRTMRKQAPPMAEAKRREELETGAYEY